jgi:predicted cobalt transporter CbtA
VIPFTKYPANPPTVGNPDTIDKRTLLFLAMIAISVLAAIAAGRIRRDLLARTSGWNAALLAVAGFIAVVVIAQLILPPVHETPPGFPADVLYRFHLASLGISLTLWTTIGLAFGVAAERLIEARQPALTTGPKQVRGLTH